MRLKLDETADAFYLRLDEAAIVESEEVKPGIVLDFNKDGVVVGVEFLDVSMRIRDKQLKNFEFEAN
ncbi:MAG TPA: DUF2283 domain-containing protein [Anaerolineales bacterium]|nr:DUF2283 domain-containing protein [Anaerolineales bacterium]HRQ92807.1 DUF2283 domain-containing protein [Anaerolineales bacterium]